MFGLNQAKSNNRNTKNEHITEPMCISGYFYGFFFQHGPSTGSTTGSLKWRAEIGWARIIFSL